MTNVVAFGEVLLRLQAPRFERMLQSGALQVHVGGAELNVLASLAQFGHRTQLVSTLPDTSIGAAALGEVRARCVDVTAIRRGSGRMGLYFAESGHGYRPGEVLYDRAASAFAADLSVRPWPELLADAALLHMTGITPALSIHAASTCIAAALAARRNATKVSVDVNFRAQLWAVAGQSCEAALLPLMQQAHILFASSADLIRCLALEDDTAADAPIESFGRHAALALEKLPGLEVVCTCLRFGERADCNQLVAIGRDRAGLYTTGQRSVDAIIDRIGAGDAFAAGVLHRLLCAQTLSEALEFGLAAATLKHTVVGDINRVSEAEVAALVQGESAARLRR